MKSLVLFRDAIQIRSGVKLEILKDVLESKGFRHGRIRTEYMGCNFGKSRNKDEGVVRFDDQEIQNS